MTGLKSIQKFFPGKPKYFGNIALEFKKKANNLINRLVNFIAASNTSLLRVGLDKIAIGLSGGIDSSVACALSKLAVGKNAFAVIIDFGDKKDTDFSISVAKYMKIKYELINGEALLSKQLSLMKLKNIMMKVHLRTRIVNNIIFQVADNESAAVVDTTDKSERLTGRHAECFYGHFAPIIDLYKSELYDVARLLKLPEAVVSKPAGCPEFLDYDVFKVDWITLDKLLFLIAEQKVSIEKISRAYDIDVLWLAKLKRRIDLQPIRLETKKLFLS